MRVVIIGAGVAGLTCARELQRRGADVVVIEASDGVGGRVRSDTYRGYILDRGFQVLFDAYPAVQRQLAIPALKLKYFDPGAIICNNQQRIILTDPLRDPNLRDRIRATLSFAISPLDKLRTLALALDLRRQTIDAMLTGPDTTSLAFLRQYGFSETFIDRFFRPFYGGILFDRELQTSTKCLKFDFKMLADGNTGVPTYGMGEISAQLAASLIAEKRIQFSVRADSIIEHGSQVVGVQLTNGEHIHADAIILATEAPEATRLSGIPTVRGAKQTVTLYYTGDIPFYKGKKLLLNANPQPLVNNAQLLTNVNPAYAPVGKHLLSAVVIGIPPTNEVQLSKAVLRDIQQMFAGDLPAQAAIAAYQPLRQYRIPYAQYEQSPGIHPTLPDNRTVRPGLYFAGEFTEASSLNAAMISGEKCAVAVLADHKA